MEYETFDPEIHDSRHVATLIYDVDFRTFDRLFKSSDKAIDAIEKNLRKEKCLKVILDDGELIGMLLFYTSDIHHEFRLKHYKLFIVDILDHFVLSDIKKGDFYLAEIAIDKDKRSKGYGRRVIHDVIDYARKNSYKRVTLDADFRNTKAKALYEKLGFKEFNRKSFLKRGMHNMELRLYEEAF
ncbi:GNAT family N-acetyltransferase [Methanobrevibacter sp.]|uniref:GNAT family N-acetyltransferase n=1 Tax=Methanobrevibacter sp. TaxID=66852 RepID=UPI00388D85CD